MNKTVYLSNIEWTKTHDNMGGVKADIVFKDCMTYDEFQKIRDSKYFVLTDNIVLQIDVNNCKIDIEKLLKQEKMSNNE